MSDGPAGRIVEGWCATSTDDRPCEEEARTIVGLWASRVGASAISDDDAVWVDRYYDRLVAARRGDRGAH